MPSSPKIKKESMVQAALEIMLKDSYASVNIKAVAGRLGCSTRPISWQFGSMDGLRQALIPAAQKYAAEKYPAPDGNTIQTLEQSGWGIIDMALDEPNLFRFLYMGESGRRVNSGLSMAPDSGTGQEAMRQLAADLGITQEEAEKFKSTMVLYTYGVAAMVASGIVQEAKENVYQMVRQTGLTFLKGLGVSEEVLQELGKPLPKGGKSQ